MTARVIKIKKGIQPGTAVPEKQHAGNIGHWTESKLKADGFKINTGKGVDLPEENLEVKSRKDESNSAHTIGKMTKKDIKSNTWHQSTLKSKCQRQYRVTYSDVDSVVTSSGIYDFTDPYIQEKFEEAYEQGRQLIQAGNEEPYLRNSQWGYFEKKKNSYEFRIPHAAMKKIITASSNSKTFNDLFDYGDPTVPQV
jgi:hypothetical protein